MNLLQPNRSSRGFTLVELLVVIVLIVAVAILGFTGYSEVRTLANQATSAGNLRQLAAANLHYASDHQTYCPTDLDGRNLTRWHGARTSVTTPFDAEKGLLSEYLGKSGRIGKCPELEKLITAASFNESGAGGYGYNDTYIGNNPFAQPEPGRPSPPNRPANLSNPTRVLMFATVALAVSGGIQDYASAAPPFEVDANGRLRGKLQPSVHFRFNGKALIAWCDGHVTEERKQGNSTTNFYGGDSDAANIGFCGPDENNGWWNPKN